MGNKTITLHTEPATPCGVRELRPPHVNGLCRLSSEVGTMHRRDYHRFRACQGKVQHATREAAEKTVERQAKKWKLNETVKLVAYRCEFCRQFHTGRQYE